MPAQYPLDALGTLLQLSWRGIEVPCQANSIDPKQRIVEHKQWGVQASHVENTGRDSARFSFKIPFRGGISGCTDLYPTRFRDFFNACLDGSAGKLIHPEFGELDACVESHPVSYDPNRRDGCDMDVVWIETNENEYVLEQSYLMADAVALATQLDGNFPDVEIPPFDDGSGLSLTESLKKLQGELLLAQLSVASIIASVGNTIDAVNGMIDFASSLANPQASVVAQYLKDIEASLSAFIAKLPGSRSVRTVIDKIVQRTQPVENAAASYGMSMEDWFALNPMTAATGEVKTGDIVFVYET